MELPAVHLCQLTSLARGQTLGHSLSPFTKGSLTNLSQIGKRHQRNRNIHSQHPPVCSLLLGPLIRHFCDMMSKLQPIYTSHLDQTRLIWFDLVCGVNTPDARQIDPDGTTNLVWPRSTQWLVYMVPYFGN